MLKHIFNLTIKLKNISKKETFRTKIGEINLQKKKREKMHINMSYLPRKSKNHSSHTHTHTHQTNHIILLNIASKC